VVRRNQRENWNAGVWGYGVSMGTESAEDTSCGELVIYTIPDGLAQAEVRLADETVWLK